MSKLSHIGFVSTRLAGTDGVSLEAAKWVKVLGNIGHECFFLAGEVDWPEERSYLLPEAHFLHPEIVEINAELLDQLGRAPATSGKMERLKNHLKVHLHQFIRQFGLDLLIVENALALPMNIPLGLAITEVTAETNLPVIAHHHDFSWERQRYSVTAADDYLRAAFPPTLHSIHHVVINSFASRQLALRTGALATLIPNVMDFNNHPQESDGYASDLRSELNIGPDQFLLLQPTRIVPRKRIELAIELTRRLGLDCVLVISHKSGDEGSTYDSYLEDYAKLMAVNVIFAADRFAAVRGQNRGGKKVYSLADAYQTADLVTYPSRIEGFGNAFLEAIYFKKPLVMSKYEIFKTDILPKGFRVIGFLDFIDSECIRMSREVLINPELSAEIAEHNYQIGRQYYSYDILEAALESLLNESLGL